MSSFSAFVLNLSKSANILFSQVNTKQKFAVQLSINCYWYLGDNSVVHELRVMVAADLHVNTTYAQHLALKSVCYGKSQPVICGKLFSFCCIGKCLNQHRVFEIGLFQKKSKQGGGGGKDIEFPGAFKKQHAEFPGVNQRQSGISKEDQEKFM